MHPWAEALYKERLSGALSKEEPDANCLPQGVPKINAAPVPWRIVQTPGMTIILYEAFGQWRQIFTDGRPLPKDPNPTWLGYSVGKWEAIPSSSTRSGSTARPGSISRGTRERPCT